MDPNRFAARQFGPGSPQEDGLSGHLPTRGSELSADLGQGRRGHGWVENVNPG